MQKKVKRQVPLKRLTTFCIGGKARYFICVGGIAELRQALAVCAKNRLPVFVLGKGSNILVADKGVRGAVISLDTPFFTGVSREGTHLIAGAGSPVAAVLAYCIRQGLGGMEFLAGIPGTIGGALAGNAGIADRGRQRSIGDLVESVLVMDYNSRVAVVSKAALRFGYRSSSLQDCVVLKATLRLHASSSAAVRKQISGYLSRRGIAQQWRYPNAGCIFKNPASASAGNLIDRCGLKGTRAGGAMISDAHANFILNIAHARAADVLRLMRLARSRVKKKFFVQLEPEIKIWK